MYLTPGSDWRNCWEMLIVDVQSLLTIILSRQIQKLMLFPTHHDDGAHDDVSLDPLLL